MIGYTIRQIRTAFMLLLFFTLLTGLIYPFAVTGIAQLFFPWRANGSLVKLNDTLIGSVLIGQTFTDPKYFWGRPSATLPVPCNTLNSSGSNYSVSNEKFLTEVSERVKHLHEADPANSKLIPVDLVTTSASGLDPHISILSALYQVPRIAKARNLGVSELNTLIQLIGKRSTSNILGEPRVNVLKLNMKLEQMKEASFRE